VWRVRLKLVIYIATQEGATIPKIASASPVISERSKSGMGDDWKSRQPWVMSLGAFGCGASQSAHVPFWQLFSRPTDAPAWTLT